MRSSLRLLPGARGALLLLPLALATGCVAARAPVMEGPPPPFVSRVEMVVDTIHGVEFPDPYRWLENGTSEETVRWVEAQNAYAERVIGNPPIRGRIEARLRELMDRESIGSPRRAGWS